MLNRLLLMAPIFDVLDMLRRKALNITRILEVILLYYFFSHVSSCLFIKLAYVEAKDDVTGVSDFRKTWMTRIPSP